MSRSNPAGAHWVAMRIAGLATATLLLAACSSDSSDSVMTPADSVMTPAAETCAPAPPGVSVGEYAFIIEGETEFRGKEAWWLADIGLITVGPEDKSGPADNGPVGQLFLFIDKPFVDDGQCKARVLDATMSTTDVRVGTGEELNGKLYELVSEEGQSGGSGSNLEVFIDLDFAGGSSLNGSVQLFLIRIIISPIEPPTFGETVGVQAEFTALRR